VAAVGFGGINTITLQARNHDSAWAADGGARGTFAQNVTVSTTSARVPVGFSPLSPLTVTAHDTNLRDLTG